MVGVLGVHVYANISEVGPQKQRDERENPLEFPQVLGVPVKTSEVWGDNADVEVLELLK